VSLLLVVALSVQAPPSIENARIEIRAGTTPAAALAEAARGQGETWVGWSVPAVPGIGEACCFDRGFKRSGCSLASREDSWGTNSDAAHGGTNELYILVRTTAGAPSRVRLMSPTCPVQGADRQVLWLGPVDAGASLAVLEKLLDDAEHRVGQSALAAVAYHADPRADALIAGRALDRAASQDTREQAIFWAGQARGQSGYRLVEGILGSDPSADIREKAAFALSQNAVPEAPERIKRASREDRSPEVRAHALFCLTQTKSEGAGDWILSRLDADQSAHVREQAVFALSQLPDGTDYLLNVLHSKRDRETIRRALFWLGQSNDPRALAELEKILDK
jgi:HEAT repeat protein